MVLLLAVATSHVAWVRCARLNPWLGGGFGMFSAPDRRWARVLEADGDALALPRGLRDLEKRALALPTRERLLTLGRAAAGDAPRPVRVEVWEAHFGPEMAPRPRLLAAATLGPAPATPGPGAKP